MDEYLEIVKVRLEPEFKRLGIVDEELKREIIQELISLANLVIDTYPLKRAKVNSCKSKSS